MKVKKQRKVRRTSGGLPFVAVVGTMGGFLLAYLVAELALSRDLHPLHWVVAGAGAVLGTGLGYLPSDLSGGEKQRVAIAHALANELPLILADKPTGNLDSKTGREVMELLCCGLGRDLGRAIVIVTHDQRLVQIADRVLWLEDGRLSDGNGRLGLEAAARSTLSSAN